MTTVREATWLEATEAGYTTAQIASLSGVSIRYVQRLVARARADRGEIPESSPTPGPSELPRLTLADSEASGPSSSPAYSLATDSVSLDGRTWIAPDDPSTPRMSVLVSAGTGRGQRKHRLEPWDGRHPPDPPGPTSHRKTPGLKGGRG